MGNGQLNQAVSDSGPLIHLGELNCLAFLKIFDAIHVPQAVWNETIELKRISKEDLSVASIHRQTLAQTEVIQFVTRNKMVDLHSGEQECLLLCRQKNIDTLLTDDLAVRDAAKRLNLTPVGSMGIVIRAYRDKMISFQDAKRCIRDLHSVSSLFVTSAVADLAIEQLRFLIEQ